MTAFDKIRWLYQLDESKNYGFSEEEIRQLETRNNSKLPDVLRTYYLTLGKQTDLNNSFNRLLHPADEAVFSADRHFVFYEENQGVISWGINEADFASDNPAVYANSDAVNLTYPWYAESPTTDDFLLYMAVWNGVMGGLKYNANTLDEGSLPENLLALVERK